jgi:type I restriction enzyme S subunit
MPQNIGDNRVVETGVARIRPHDAARLSRYLVRPGDIVYSRRGDVEKRALIREHEAGWLCGTGCLRIRFGKADVDPTYASYYLGHPQVRAWITQHAHGATMPNLNTEILSETPFLVPPLEDQRRIGGILGALDDKIELNRRMSQTLEGMAFAAYREFRLRSSGRVEQRLSELVALNPARSLARGIPAPYLDMANMPTSGPAAGDFVTRAVGSGMRFMNGDTLMARITPCLENGKLAFVDFLREGEVGWGSTEYIVLRPKAPLPVEFAYCLVRDPAFVEFAVARMSGTSGRQRVSAVALGDYPLRVDMEAAATFARHVRPAFRRISSIARENRHLASVRNTLLPV